MVYLSYTFKVSPPEPGSEILMALISDHGFESFDFNELGFTAYIKEENVRELNLESLVFDDFNYSYEVNKIQATNWNSEWEKNFEPVFVNDLLHIRAPFHSKNSDYKYEIVIMPKMSFGTGHHQTTRLVCQAMFTTNFNNKRVLDMGCGTGLLAILAKLLGANKILAIDIDEWSVENSIENCRNNNGSDIVVKLGDIDVLEEEESFDIIIANINKNILIQHLSMYSKKLSNGGKLFLSGFFITDTDELKIAAQHQNLTFCLLKNENEWAMLMFQKID